MVKTSLEFFFILNTNTKLSIMTKMLKAIKTSNYADKQNALRIK